ncbi:hypothetical protein ACQI4F_03515 [Mycolicibacterium vaccae]|uniref:hypothetical protein n=1 Tax=Mycolicibacterium vaccae TaxID=1810 RepID=UPI003CE98BDE
MAFRFELFSRLDDLVDGLRAAGERFDQGKFAEATVLATRIRDLVHGGGATTALIDQLEVAGRLTWVDTAGVPDPNTAWPTACLTLMKVGDRSPRGGEFVPKMSLYPPAPIRTRDGDHIDRGSRIPFEHWWTNPVLRDVDGVEYTRRQMVLALASRLPTPVGHAEDATGYEALRACASLGPRNPVAASVRQIAYEVMQTIAQQREILGVVPARLAG